MTAVSAPGWLWWVFPLYFAGLSYGVLLFLSSIGGWRRLAKAYPDESPVEGLTFHWQSAQFGSVYYRGCVNVTLNPIRVRLSMVPLCRVWHPAINVPWSEIRVEMGRTWFREVGTFRFAREPGVRVRLRRRLVDRMAEASRGQLQIHAPRP